MIANTIFKGVLLKLLSVNGLSQENTESNITNYETLQKYIITSYILLLRNVTRYLVTLKVIYYVT